MGCVMRQLTVEMEEEEMAQLEATVRARRIDPAHMTKAQLLKLLGAGKKTKWRGGLGVRRAGVALKGAKIVFTLRPNSTRENHVLPLRRPDRNPAMSEEDQLLPTPEARARRLKALMTMQGIWKGDPDKPQDGVAYQQEVRAEWR